MNTILRLTDVSVERNGTAILSSVRWHIAQGQHWVVFGPNGAGKTTLLQVLTGYLWPMGGTVEVLGRTLGHVDLAELRREIALVSDPIGDMLNHQLTGFETLVTGRRAHLNLFDPPTPKEAERALKTAAATGVEELLEKPYAVMSTGERRRLLIARALMAKPRIIVLDEPCAGLDLAGREFVLETIEAAAVHDPAPTLVLTTHHAEEITSVFTHALLLTRGRVQDSGPLSSVFTSDNLSALFGIPIKVTHNHHRWHANPARGPFSRRRDH